MIYVLPFIILLHAGNPLHFRHDFYVIYCLLAFELAEAKSSLWVFLIALLLFFSFQKVGYF